MSQVTILKKPLLPVIKIQKNDGSFYTFNHFTGTYDFRLRQARIVPATDGMGGYFQFIIAHPNPSTLVSLAQDIEQGNEVKVWVGKTDTSAGVPRLLGKIEKRTFAEPTKSWADLILTGLDWGTALELNRIGNAYYDQRKLGDGVTVDPTDDSTNIRNIIIDLLTNRDRYLLPGISIEDQGAIIEEANITDTGRQLENFKVDAQPIRDAINLLDDEDGTIHYYSGDKRFHRVFPTAVDSGILLTDDPRDSVALAWNQAKVGLIVPNTTFELNSEERVSVLMGLGGDEIDKDQVQETIDDYTLLDALYWAKKFRPSFRDTIKFQLPLGKVGTPTADLRVLLVESDESGEPNGSEIRSVTIPKAEISTVADISADPLKAWRTVVIGDENLNTAKDHWIICLYKNGDASNTLAWYKNAVAGSSGTSKSSSDLSSWSDTTDSFGFRTYFKTPVLAIMIKPGGTSSSDKYYRERVIKKPSITNIQEMYSLLSSQKLFYFNNREVFRSRIYAPDNLLDNNQKVRIRKQQTKYTFDYSDFVVSGIEWVFQERIGSFYYDATFTRFAS